MENLNHDLAEARERLRQAEALRRRRQTVESDLRTQRELLSAEAERKDFLERA